MLDRWTNLLQNKTIIVTGSSSGIGRECAIQCSKQGANLILMGRNSEKLHNTLEHLDAGKHRIVLCDLSQPNQIKVIKDDLISYGPVHGMVHCAGRQKAAPLKVFDVDEFENLFRINVSAGIELSRIVSSPMVFDKAGGSIIFISSVSAVKAEKGKLEYSATKAALISIVKTMALELAAKQIRVNAISPAMVKTPMLDTLFSELPENAISEIQRRHLMGIIDPIEIADLSVFLLSDLSRKITGSNIIIDSGYSLT